MGSEPICAYSLNDSLHEELKLVIHHSYTYYEHCVTFVIEGGVNVQNTER